MTSLKNMPSLDNSLIIFERLFLYFPFLNFLKLFVILESSLSDKSNITVANSLADLKE